MCKLMRILIELKPVQRICRYHLLLQELSKYTPSSDCPSSYNEIKQVADNLKALASQVNTAANRTDRIRQTILLQKKLVFPGSVSRLFGFFNASTILLNINRPSCKMFTNSSGQ